MSVLILSVTWLGLGRADDAAVTAILDKAIKETGGADNLLKLQGCITKAKAIQHEPGQPDTVFTGTWYNEGADKMRSETEQDIKGKKVVEIIVVNGSKGWKKTANGASQQIEKEELAAEQDNAYLSWISTLAPLKNKEFKLTSLPDAMVHARAAVGFSVALKDHRDVKMYFDKENGLLVKCERKVWDTENKKAVTEEVLYSDYKTVDGIKVAMKIAFKWDGKPVMEIEASDVRLQEKLDDKLFTRP